ncbi:PREDICTED: epididymal sperm-binding protein 1-like [Acropora digitifera]|uniref:epididymal sperm-binding protein 1-like n=1 Tax=Acropora digitifera TaxID=70779 RepID=UPI00077A4960|nr:PREDICTED: epididymal sperm-binding protein 1-like [Acropora digitifera]
MGVASRTNSKILVSTLVICVMLEVTSCASDCRQKTVDRHCCRIPFVYRGVTYNSCTKKDWHAYWCSLDAVYRGRWRNCALPLVSQQSSQQRSCSQKTTSRHCCSIPFKYGGVTYNSCTKKDWHSYWCSLDPVYKGRWGNCALPLVPQKPSCTQKTTAGKCCSIPFKYKGKTYNSCTLVDFNTPWCSLDPVYNGNRGNCPSVCNKRSTAGKCCSYIIYPQ